MDLYDNLYNLHVRVETLRNPKDDSDNRNNEMMSDIIDLRNKLITNFKVKTMFYWDKEIGNEIDKIVTMVDLVLNERKKFIKHDENVRWSKEDKKDVFRENFCRYIEDIRKLLMNYLGLAYVQNEASWQRSELDRKTTQDTELP